MPRITNINQKPVSKTAELSGAEKNKKRKKQQEDDAKQAKNASKFFKAQDSLQNVLIAPSASSAVSQIGPVPSSESNSDNDENHEVNNRPIEVTDSGDQVLDQNEPCGNAPSKQFHEDFSAKFIFDSSDPSTWTNPLSQGELLQLLNAKPCQDRNREFPKLGDRSFHHSHFMKICPTNERIVREWLLYSNTTNTLFCYACCLFGSTSSINPWMNYGLQREGFKDYVHVSRGISYHESSKCHFESMIKWKQHLETVDSSRSLNIQSREEFNKELSFWKSVLHSIIDSVLFLAKNNLAFRGSSDKIGDRNCGNFLSLIELLSKYHPPLALHVSRISKGKVSYMSHHIQTEFIGIAASSVRQRLLNQILSRKFFSIMFDATPDVSHKEQISQIIRTVQVSADGCQIEENFIDFIHFDGKTGLQLTEAILTKIKKDGLEIANCRGQGYDNGSNMAGIYRGVQARIMEINPLATFIPCAAHSLNLVGQNAASKSLEARLILGQIQTLFVFFSASPSRWNILKLHVKKTLKGHSATRWSSRSDAVLTLFEEFEGVYESLCEMLNSEATNNQTLADANSQINQIWNFKFLLGITLWNFILGRIQITNLALQKKNIEIEEASKHLEGLVEWLRLFQIDGFEQALQKTKVKAQELGIDEESGFSYRVTRNVRPRRYRTEETQSIPIAVSNIERFKTDFFVNVMGHLLEEFERRFSAIKSSADNFNFMWGRKLDHDDKQQLTKAAMDLANCYKSDIDGPEFLNEIQYLKSAVSPFLKDQQLKNSSAMDILNILTGKGLDQQFVNVQTALRVFLTLPVTVASNERSFSKLKIIKNHLRSTMGQERLSNLSILSIESDYVQTLTFDTIINDFAAAKCRKVPL